MNTAPTGARQEDSLTYALRWRVSGVIPGAHRGSDDGQTGHFRQVVAFDRSPDPRRIDLRATVRDPFGLLYVRRYEQRVAARVQVLVDASASMLFGIRSSRYALAVAVAAAIARAAHDIHDFFALAACGESIQVLSAGGRGNPAAFVAALAAIRPRGRSARALLDAGRQLTGRRRLVFLVSDFGFPAGEVAALLDSLTAHDVVPVYVAEDLERSLPRWGLVELEDLENGRRRFVALRPSLRARWLKEVAEHEAQISALCAARGRRPFVLEGAFEAEAFANYLLAG